MNTTAPKIVLDTNILIASIGRRSPFRWIFDCIVQGKIILCISNDILLEYREILARKASEQVAENITNFLAVSPFTEKVEIYFNFELITLIGPTTNSSNALLLRTQIVWSQTTDIFRYYTQLIFLNCRSLHLMNSNVSLRLSFFTHSHTSTYQCFECLWTSVIL